ncbi:MAG: hypothetical protein KAV44_05900, partial [Bacteroidales bacterium]|nr:hypothetical protein [Bacteroidales bacterium]
MIKYKKSMLKLNCKLSVLLIATLMFAVNSFAQKVTYSDSWGKSGISLKNENSSGVIVNFSINEFTFTDRNVDGESMKAVHLPGHFLPNNEGAPDLPGSGRYIAVPQGAKAKLKVIASRTEKYSNVNIAPAPRIPKDNENGPLIYKKDRKIYTLDKFYPSEPVLMSPPTKIRGVDVVMLGVTPFQYNPITKELIIYRDIEIEVTFEGGNGLFGDDSFRSRWFDPILQGALLNKNSLPEIDYSISPSTGLRTEDYEYIIIVPDDPAFISWADSLKQWRINQGIRTGVVTTTEIGGNTSTAIENYIDNAYNTWDVKPVAVLLIGDYGTSGNTIISPTWNSTCVSDHIYADVNGNNMADVILARMTAQNEGHLETMVGKILYYERNPPTNPDFYDHPITALGWQTSRWFQICSESVGGFLKNIHGKDPVRINAIYSGNPNVDPWSTATNTSIVVNYFGPDGLGYIPATPAELGGWTGGNATAVNNAINSGAFILQHRDHGGLTGWGEPDYSISDLSGLSNDDLVFVFSINCLTGKFNASSECFAEAFHRHQQGALGIIAASEISYSFVNDTYVWGMYDNMWPEFMPDFTTTPDSRGVLPAFGNAAGKYFLEQSNWPYNTGSKMVTYYLFHHHGGAFSTVYSEIPQNLTVTHDNVLLAGLDFFTVTANEGSLIALTVGDEIIGIGVGTGAPLNISITPQLPPTIVEITVTKQNYFRYNASVQVIPPVGAYVIKDSYTINDDSGNGNGEIDYGESILLSLTMKNVGSENAENTTVNIETDDDYITLTTFSAFYGNIPAGGTATVIDGFAFDVANNIPDEHVIYFNVIATDGDSIWNSNFTSIAYAPELTVGNMTIDDAAGGNGNGYLDPGETADLIIATSNFGHSDALNVTASISTTCGLVTLNSTSYDFGTIVFGETSYATFNITVDDEAPIGTCVDIDYEVISGEYNAQYSFYATVGIIFEDWETGDFSQFSWVQVGNLPWVIDDADPYEGVYCAKSGSIGNNSSSGLSISFEILYDDSISFYRKVSSEASYDFLEFYIDETKVDSWSGEVDWGRVAYAVTGGDHTFKWVYTKDTYETGGSDCGWIDYIVFPPINTAPVFQINDLTVVDSVTGNNNGRWDPGETVELIVSITNTGLSQAFNAGAVISSSSNYITINSDTSFIGNIPANSSAEAIFNVTASILAAPFAIVDIEFDISAAAGITANKIFNVPVGKKPVLIVDLDPNNSSGPAIYECVENTGLTTEYVTSLSADVNSYYSIFVCLGIYNNNYILQQSEGQLLADFLDNGGNLYMEGGDTWYYDTQTTVHSYFKINPTADGSSDLSTINGQSGSITEGLSYAYAGENNWIDHISPISPAELIFKNQSPLYDCGVAYDAGNYKTIGVSFEFGGLVNGTNTKQELMEKYLEFFGFTGVPTAPPTPTGSTEVCANAEQVEYYTNSVENTDLYIWIIEPAEAGTISGIDTLITINWNGAYTGETATIKVCGMNQSGFGPYSDNLVVNMLELPSATLSGEASICYGDSTQLTVELSGLPPWEIITGNLADTFDIEQTPWSHWVKPETTTEFTIFSVTHANGCTNSGSGNALVTVYELPQPDLGPDTNICINHVITLYPGSFISYEWFDGSTEPEFVFNA